MHLLAGRELQEIEVSDLAASSEVTVAELGRHYATLEDCVLAAYDQAVGEIYQRCRDALAGPGVWHDRFRAAIAASFDLYVLAPGLARLVLLEAARFGDGRMHRRRAEAKLQFARLLAAEANDADLSTVHFEFVLGVLYSAAREHLAEGYGLSSLGERVAQLVDVLEPARA